jgi:integrase
VFFHADLQSVRKGGNFQFFVPHPAPKIKGGFSCPFFRKDGNIHMKKRKDGRYQKKVTLSDGRQKLVYGRTIAEVNQAADALRIQDQQGLVVGDTTTVDEWAKLWIKTYKGDLRANTLAMYRNAYNVHILPYLATMPLQEVRPVNVREVMKAVAGMSESTQHKVLITMRQLFTTARQNRLIISDPTEGVKTTPHANPPKKAYLTLEEQESLMTSVSEPRARCFVGLCLYCGLRREEALGLQWGDIAAGKLTVNRAVTFIGNQPDPVQELKTKAAHRTIPIPKVLQDILSLTPRLGLYVVPRADGRAITRIGFRRLWESSTKGLSFPLHPHMLRHSYATNLYRAGIDLKTAQYLLGHATIQMTANIYTHIEKEDATASIVQLERYLSGKTDFSESSQKVVNRPQ